MAQSYTPLWILLVIKFPRLEDLWTWAVTLLKWHQHSCRFNIEILRHQNDFWTSYCVLGDNLKYNNATISSFYTLSLISEFLFIFYLGNDPFYIIVLLTLYLQKPYRAHHKRYNSQGANIFRAEMTFTKSHSFLLDKGIMWYISEVIQHIFLIIDFFYLS